VSNSAAAARHVLAFVGGLSPMGVVKIMYTKAARPSAYSLQYCRLLPSVPGSGTGRHFDESSLVAVA
jgi:hypothetical protein